MRPTASRLERAPPEAYAASSRLAPIRKPPGFVPAVQRWSACLPGRSLRVAFFAAQSRDAGAISASSFRDWVGTALVGHAAGPTTLDRARFTDDAGFVNHVVAAYWVDDARFDVWTIDPAVEGWWTDPARLAGPVGVWREILVAPPERLETIYWSDYPAGLMRSPEVAVYPTPYCGYYGAMRDRLRATDSDPLDVAAGASLEPAERAGFGERWRVDPPGNIAVIRSASTWGLMDAEQLADYRAKLAEPLAHGMDYLRDNPVESGCASLRMQQTIDADGAALPETHALGYFLSLRHMERWAEGHGTHAAIFGAAISRYRRYGAANQLRTWHEVLVLPEGGQRLEYTNCHPATGLLPYFAARRLA